MDKQTLSNYGWLVIVTLILAVMLALATPFGTYVGDAVVSVANGYVGASNNAMDDDNISSLEQQWNEKLMSNDGKYDYNKGDPDLNPDDGTTPANRDTYTYGDYKYTYYIENASYGTGWNVSINTAVTDKNQTSYGAILESINGEPVTCMYYTFKDCTSLITVPEIPNGVTNMQSTFYNCTNLKTVPEIPSGVTKMYYTFEDCISLTTAPDITNCKNLIGVGNVFANCTALVDASKFVIPESVNNIQYAFKNCTSLTGKVTNNATSPEFLVDVFLGIDFQAQKLTLDGTCSRNDYIGTFQGGINYCKTCNGYCYGGH